MDRDELMRLAADKAIREVSWESIEFLFRPATLFELLLRLDFDGMRQKAYDWMGDNNPDAVPHRFRSKPFQIMLRAIKVEEFYRLLRSVRDSQ